MGRDSDRVVGVCWLPCLMNPTNIKYQHSGGGAKKCRSGWSSRSKLCQLPLWRLRLPIYSEIEAPEICSAQQEKDSPFPVHLTSMNSFIQLFISIHFNSFEIVYLLKWTNNQRIIIITLFIKNQKSIEIINVLI